LQSSIKSWRWYISGKELMLAQFRKSNAVGALLCGIIILAMWGNALAGVFCPHMSGGKCCLPDHSHLPSTTADCQAVPLVEHRHVDHEPMSDMDMEDGSMAMDDAQISTAESAPEPPQVVDAKAAPSASGTEAITTADEPCSHCIMHSRTGERFPSSAILHVNSDQVASPDTTVATLNPETVLQASVELHDHSPPGSAAPLYVLMSTFRI
jgi:hypothetical protein